MRSPSIFSALNSTPLILNPIFKSAFRICHTSTKRIINQQKEGLNGQKPYQFIIPPRFQYKNDRYHFFVSHFLKRYSSDDHAYHMVQRTEPPFYGGFSHAFAPKAVPFSLLQK